MMVSVAAQLMYYSRSTSINSKFSSGLALNTGQSKHSAEVNYIKAYQDCSAHVDPIMLPDVLKLNIFNVFKFTTAHTVTDAMQLIDHVYRTTNQRGRFQPVEGLNMWKADRLCTCLAKRKKTKTHKCGNITQRMIFQFPCLIGVLLFLLPTEITQMQV